MKNLSIVIVSWNVRDLLLQCLDSIAVELAKNAGICAEIFVVDNASSDDSVTRLKEGYSWIKLIENYDNVGFAAANNQAIRQSDAEYILLLNPDTIVKSGGLANLITFMNSNSTAGAAGSKLLNVDGSLQPSCFPQPTLSRELWRLFHFDRFYPLALYDMDKWDDRSPRQVDIIQGTSLILRQAALQNVGLLDENFFMYSEEVDLCFRLRQANWSLFWAPTSQIVHYGGQSSQQVASAMFLQLYQNKLRYFRKHHGRFAGMMYKGILLLAALPRLLLKPFTKIGKPALQEKRLNVIQNYELLIRMLPGM